MKLAIAALTLFSVFAHAADDPKVSLETLKSILNKTGAPKVQGTEKSGTETVPGLYFGTRKINGNNAAVDEVKKKHGGVATVFVKSGEEYIRISTNALKPDGTRGIGTSLLHNKAYEAVQKGETYCGDAEILSTQYDTCYEPIKADGKVIGIYLVGYPKK